MTRRIAIIKASNSSSYENYELVIDKVTDFVEVTDEEYGLLNASQYQEGYQLIEAPLCTKEYLSGILGRARERKEIQDKEALRVKKAAEVAREKQRKARELVAKQKADREVEREKKLLADLARKLGVELPQDQSILS